MAYNLTTQRYILEIDGPHGIGKTTTIDNIKKSTEEYGDDCIEFVGEHFDHNPINPQGIVNEIGWIVKRFRILRKTTKSIVLCDRSHYSASIYCTNSNDLVKDVIKQMRKEFEKDENVKFVSIFLTDSIENILLRLKNRTKDKEVVKKLQETNISKLNMISKRYDDYSSLWDYTFDSKYTENLKKVISKLLKKEK